MSPSLLPSFERGKLRILTGSSFTNAFGGDENYPIQQFYSCLPGHNVAVQSLFLSFISEFIFGVALPLRNLGTGSVCHLWGICHTWVSLLPACTRHKADLLVV